MHPFLLVVSLCVLFSASARSQCSPPSLEDFDASVPSPSSSCGLFSPGILPSGWSNDSAAPTAWRPRSGSTPSLETGPNGDRTTGTGIYIYSEASGCSAGTEAVLLSPCFDLTTTQDPVVDFWIHMAGTGSGRFEIDIQNSLGQWTTLWRQTGPAAPDWLRVQESLEPNTGTVRFRLRSLHNGNFRGDVAIDDFRVGPRALNDYEVNFRAASLRIDGVLARPFLPAIVRRYPGDSIHLHLGSNLSGQPWDLILSGAPLVPTSLGAPMTAGGQILNLDLSASLVSSAAFLVPWPALEALNFSAVVGNSVGTTSAQFFILDPTSLDGTSFSQATQLDVQTAIPSAPIPGPTGDDSTVTIDFGTPLIPFMGTVWREIHVSSNGRVLFEGPDTDFSATIAEFQSDGPSVGFWTDLNPASGGSISIEQTSPGLLAARYSGIPYFSEPTSSNSFDILFNVETAEVLLDNLGGIQPNPLSSGSPGGGDGQILGLSPGLTGNATNAGPTPFSFGTQGLPISPTDMIYDSWIQGDPLPALPPSLTSGLQQLGFYWNGSSYGWWGGSAPPAPPCVVNILRASAPRPPQTSNLVNVGQYLKLEAHVQANSPPVSYFWSVPGSIVKDYEEAVGPLDPNRIGNSFAYKLDGFSTAAMQAADYRRRTIEFYWEPTLAQTHPNGPGLIQRQVTCTVTLLSGQMCVGVIDLNVERNMNSSRLQAEDWYTEYNHPTLTSNKVCQEHLAWHQSHPRPAHRPLNGLVDEAEGGRLFLQFHTSFLNRFKSWRARFGYPGIGTWDPGTPIPTGFTIDHSPRSGAYTLHPIPDYLTAAGGGTSPDLGRSGFTTALNLRFQNSGELGFEVEYPWHNSVHRAIGGDMSASSTAVRDPIFWRWHLYIDLAIHYPYLNSPGATP